MRREPLLTRGVIVALATALLAALVVFGVDLTGKETKAILTLVGALAPVLVALLSRPKVTPNVDVVAQRLPELSAPLPPFADKERVVDRPVVAGPSSPLPDGTLVRVVPVGSPPD